MIKTIFYFEPSKDAYLSRWNNREIDPRTIVFVGETGEIFKGGEKFGGSSVEEINNILNDREYEKDIVGIEGNVGYLLSLITGLKYTINNLISNKQDEIKDIINNVLSGYTWLKGNTEEELDAFLTTKGFINKDSALWTSIIQKIDSIDRSVISLANDQISETSIKQWINNGVAGIDLNAYALKADISGLLTSSDFEELLDLLFALKLQGTNAFLSLLADVNYAKSVLGAWSYNQTIADIIGTLVIDVDSLNEQVTTSLSSTIRHYLDGNPDVLADYLQNQAGLVLKADLDEAIASIYSSTQFSNEISYVVNSLFDSLFDSKLSGTNSFLLLRSDINGALAILGSWASVYGNNTVTQIMSGLRSLVDTLNNTVTTTLESTIRLYLNTELSDGVVSYLLNQSGLVFQSDLEAAIAAIYSSTQFFNGVSTVVNNTAGLITESNLDSALATIIAMNGSSLGITDQKVFYCKEEDTSATPATFTVAAGKSIKIGQYYSADELSDICVNATSSTLLNTTAPFLIADSSSKYKIERVSATEGAMASSKLYAAIQVGIKGDSSFINAIADLVSITASSTVLYDTGGTPVVRIENDGCHIGRGPLNGTALFDYGGGLFLKDSGREWNVDIDGGIEITNNSTGYTASMDSNGISWAYNKGGSSEDVVLDISKSSNNDVILSSDNDLRLNPTGKIIIATSNASGTEIDSPLTVGGATTFNSTVSINDNVFIGSSSSANSTTLNVYDTVTTINSIAEIYKIKSSSNTIGQISAGVVSGTGNVEIAGTPTTNVSDVDIHIVAGGNGHTSISGMTAGIGSGTNTKVSCGSGVSAQDITLTTSGITASSNISSSSDERKKNIIQQKTVSINDIANVRIVDFEYNGSESHRQYTGTIAQDWLDIVPNAVTQGPDGYYSLDYSGISIVSAVTAAREIVALKNENNILRERLEAVEARLLLLENA